MNGFKNFFHSTGNPGNNLRNLGSALTFGFVRRAAISTPVECLEHVDAAFEDSHAKVHDCYPAPPHVLHGVLVLG
jgi:hypothetical protein